MAFVKYCSQNGFWNLVEMDECVRIWPRRLHHGIPGWVKCGAAFHIRLRAHGVKSLTEPETANGLLQSAKHYQLSGAWYADLLPIMPDHIHALVSFPADAAMTTVVGNWKRFTSRTHGIAWQKNFFDHRIRNDDEFGEKWGYILRNPVAKGLCANEQDWPWVLRADDGGARRDRAGGARCP